MKKFFQLGLLTLCTLFLLLEIAGLLLGLYFMFVSQHFYDRAFAPLVMAISVAALLVTLAIGYLVLRWYKTSRRLVA